MVVAVFGQYHVKFQIKSLPPHSSGGHIYVAGSFNGWNPQDEKLKMQQDKNGGYFIELQLQPALYEYKITRGGWDKVECHKEGEAIENRILKVERDTMIELNIENWADRFESKPNISTASKNVHIINTAFLIPQKINPLSLLPVKIPLKVFADVGTYSDAWKQNSGLDHFLFDAGLQVSILKETINIYLPLLYSKAYSDYIKTVLPQKNRFLKTVSFSIDISNFTTRKINKDLSF